MLLDWILTKEGFYVKTASDADRALHILDEETFDMAILDIQMYPMDGIRLLSELRKRSPSTAVIMTTAYPAPDILSECVEHGADALLAVVMLGAGPPRAGCRSRPRRRQITDSGS